MKVRKAVIPAAGLGTRMLPATKTVPKEMLPIVDKPTLQYIMEEISAAGIEDVLIITNRGKTALEDYFDNAPELEERLIKSGKDRDLARVQATSRLANVHYIRQMETKGLGHAIWRAKDFVGNEPFAVLLGDDVMKSKTPVIKQLADAASETGCACVGMQKVDTSVIDKYCTLGVTHIKDRLYDISEMIEKPKPEQVLSNFAILGRYVLTPGIFDILETLPAGHGGEIQLTDAINILCRKERVTGIDFEGKRYDAGNLSGFLELTVDFALEHPEVKDFMRDFIIKKAMELR